VSAESEKLFTFIRFELQASRATLPRAMSSPGVIHALPPAHLQRPMADLAEDAPANHSDQVT
jgi:hypothetical protein